MEFEEYRRIAAAETSHWWYPATRALLAQEFAPRLVPGGRFLDAGGGTGATGSWMEQYGRVEAADIEPMGLDLYGRAHPAAGRTAADLLRLPYREDSFDAALCVTVLYHRAIVEPSDAVRELVRVVRPGGVVCLMEPGVRRLRRAHDRVTHTGRRFARGDLVTMLRDVGCDVVRSTGAYSFLVPPAALKAALERGRSASDLDTAEAGFGGVLSAVASAERAVLRRTAIPFGLSVMAIGIVR